MSVLDLWLIGHTTKDISSVDYVHALAKGTKGLFGLEDVTGQWLDERSGRSKAVALSALSGEHLEEIYQRGAIAFTDPDEETLDAGIEWNKVRGQERDAYLSAHGYRQNNFVLKTLSRLVESEPFRERYVGFCKEQATTFDVSYLYAFDPRLSRARFSTRAGLGSGLQDVYWINVFGRPYVEMMGADRILACPAESAQRIGEHHILVKATDAFLKPTSPAMAEAGRRIRDHIGEDYFVRGSEPRAEKQRQGAMGLFGGLKLLYSARKDFENTSHDARIRPEFDFSNILIDE